MGFCSQKYATNNEIRYYEITCNLHYYRLTAWRRVHLRKLTAAQPVKRTPNPPPTTETEGSIPYHQSPPPAPILTHIKPIHIHQTYFLKTHFNIILPFMTKSSEQYLPLTLPKRNFVSIYHLPHACFLPRPSHPP
jgi:hypothetical protein